MYVFEILAFSSGQYMLLCVVLHVSEGDACVGIYVNVCVRGVGVFFFFCVRVFVYACVYLRMYVDCPATPGNQEEAALKHTHLKYTAALLSPTQQLRQLNHPQGRRNC